MSEAPGRVINNTIVRLSLNFTLLYLFHPDHSQKWHSSVRCFLFSIDACTQVVHMWYVGQCMLTVSHAHDLSRKYNKYKMPYNIPLAFSLIQKKSKGSRNVRQKMHLLKWQWNSALSGAPFAVWRIPTPVGFEFSKLQLRFRGPLGNVSILQYEIQEHGACLIYIREFLLARKIKHYKWILKLSIHYHVQCLTQEPDVPDSTPGPATYFRFSFR